MQAPAAEATLQIASPQRVRLTEVAATSRGEMKTDLLDETSLEKRPCCIVS